MLQAAYDTKGQRGSVFGACSSSSTLPAEAEGYKCIIGAEAASASESGVNLPWYRWLPLPEPAARNRSPRDEETGRSPFNFSRDRWLSGPLLFSFGGVKDFFLLGDFARGSSEPSSSNPPAASGDVFVGFFVVGGETGGIIADAVGEVRHATEALPPSPPSLCAGRPSLPPPLSHSYLRSITSLAP